jgi:hypothetical protein
MDKSTVEIFWKMRFGEDGRRFLDDMLSECYIDCVPEAYEEITITPNYTSIDGIRCGLISFSYDESTVLNINAVMRKNYIQQVKLTK